MRRALTVLILSGGCAAVACAEEPPAPAEDSVMVQGRGMVRSFTEGVARTVDRWFGDKPFEQGGRVSGSIGFKVLVRQDDEPNRSLNFRARLNLPNLSDKLYLFVGKENEQEMITDRPEAFRRRELLLPVERRDEERVFAGVGAAFMEALEFRVGVRGGLKPYAQGRYKRDWMLGPEDAIAFRETVFWRSADGLGSTTALNYSHALSPTVALRWQNAATISEDTDGWTWSTSVGAFKLYGKNHTASLEAIMTGDTGEKDNVSEYGVRAVWERPVYRDWTILELSIGHFWPREDGDDARKHWALGLGVKVNF